MPTPWSLRSLSQLIHSRRTLLLSLSLTCGMISRTFAADAPQAWWAYVGTYTNGASADRPASEGIYVFRWDHDGAHEVKLAAKTMHPSFVAIHPSGKYLYSVGETSEFQGQPTGAVTAFAIQHASGELTSLNSQTSGGKGPCHLVVSANAAALLVANYGGGNLASIGLNADGSLGDVLSFFQHQGASVNAQRQQEPHAHSINLDHENQYAVVADLGLDEVRSYRFDRGTGKLEINKAHPYVKIPAGSGPRHLAFHPDGRVAYVINELASTISVVNYHSSSGQMLVRQTISTLPDDFKEPSYTAEVVVHPNGRFVYGSNRGHDSIAVFRVARATGELQRVQIAPTGGRTPRNFVIDPTGQFLLAENQDSDSIVIHRIDPQSGELTPTGKTIAVPIPVCIRFVPISE